MDDGKATERECLFARIDAARAEYARSLDVSPAGDAARLESARREAEAALRQALVELEPLRPR